MDPCGTPALTVFQDDSFPFITSLCYNPSDNSWMGKESDSHYDKRNISVEACVFVLMEADITCRC